MLINYWYAHRTPHTIVCRSFDFQGPYRQPCGMDNNVPCGRDPTEYVRSGYVLHSACASAHPTLCQLSHLIVHPFLLAPSLTHSPPPSRCLWRSRVHLRVHQGGHYHWPHHPRDRDRIRMESRRDVVGSTDGSIERCIYAHGTLLSDNIWLQMYR